MKSDWSNLPTHLLDSVFRRLMSPSDHLRFKCVCNSWHVAKDRQNQSAILTSHPMLLISDQRKDTWNVYDIINDEVLKLQLRLSSKRFCGSSKGWLIAVDENFRVTLINPLSKVKGRRERENSIIRLPPLNPPGERLWAKNSDYSVLKATISGDPILNANDCIVVIIYEPACRLAFIRLNQDKEWTYVVRSGVEYNGLIFYEDVAPIGGKLYAVNFRSALLAFEYTKDAISNAKVVARGFKTKGKIYLVGSSEEELLMVHRIIDYDEDGRHEDMVKRVTKGFRIYGLDSANKKWIEKDNLGNVALFVGENTSISVDASNVLGCEPNCIYFYHDHDRIQKHHVFQDFGVYDVGSGRIKKPALAKTLLIKTKQPPIWLLPTLQI